MKKILIITMLMACFSLIGCMTTPIQQGNVLDQATVSKLKTGMTRDEVQSLLGSPVLANAFDPDIWTYVYTIQTKRKQILRKKLVLYFKYNRLIGIQSEPKLTEIPKSLQ